MDQQMSYFLPPITNTLPTGNCTLREVYRWITEDKSLETVTNELRAFIREGRIAEYRQLKQRQLPFVTPHPKQWFELARCKYDAPQGFDSVSLLKDNVASERCAILRYQEIADFTNGKDFTTCDIAKHILAEEEEHEQDLQDYLTDIARMKKSFLEK